MASALPTKEEPEVRRLPGDARSFLLNAGPRDASHYLNSVAHLWPGEKAREYLLQYVMQYMALEHTGPPEVQYAGKTPITLLRCQKGAGVLLSASHLNVPHRAPPGTTWYAFCINVASHARERHIVVYARTESGARDCIEHMKDACIPLKDSCARIIKAWALLMTLMRQYIPGLRLHERVLAEGSGSSVFPGELRLYGSRLRIVARINTTKALVDEEKEESAGRLPTPLFTEDQYVATEHYIHRYMAEADAAPDLISAPMRCDGQVFLSPKSLFGIRFSDRLVTATLMPHAQGTLHMFLTKINRLPDGAAARQRAILERKCRKEVHNMFLCSELWNMDIKNANLLVMTENDRPEVRITDFEILYCCAINSMTCPPLVKELFYHLAVLTLAIPYDNLLSEDVGAFHRWVRERMELDEFDETIEYAMSVKMMGGDHAIALPFHYISFYTYPTREDPDDFGKVFTVAEYLQILEDAFRHMHLPPVQAVAGLATLETCTMGSV